MSKALLNEYFKTLNPSISLFPETKVITFKTIEKFLEYVMKEKDFWRTTHNQVYRRFEMIEIHIKNSQSFAESDLERAKNELQQAIELASAKQWPTIYSKTSVAQFIKKQVQIHSDRGEAAIQYLVHKRINNINHYNYFKGYINSYIFEESAKAFNEAAAAQEASLNELHNEYTAQLNSLNEEYHRNVARWLTDSEEFKKKTTEWRETIEREFQDKLTTILNELEDIKEKYEEKLRLEGPATYWKKLEIEYDEAGNRWRKWAIGSTVAFVILMTFILLFQPDYKFFNNGIFDFNSLRNALIFTIITSVCIYLITLFVKLSISAYHLSRDAKERYQMTHVYLSLLNKNAVNEAERITILQSIFSRADTGLLKGDGGPTMPDSLSQIFNMFKNNNR